jgi:NTE family protein
VSLGSTAVVLAGGGERVVAWQAGVLAGLADAGLDAREAPLVVGTSAGALAAAALGRGDPRAHADAIAATASLPPRQRARARANPPLEPVPVPADAVVAAVAHRLDGAAWSPALRIATIDADTGARIVLDGDSGVELARAVAAARAVPGVLPAIPAAGRRLVDAAIESPTNADLLLDADPRPKAVIVISLAGADDVSDPIEALWRPVIAAELAMVEAAGIVVHRVAASAVDRAAMGPAWLDPRTAPAAVRAGRATGAAAAGRVLRAELRSGVGA